MSYDNPERISYSFPAEAFGAATITKYIQGPKGKRGRVRHVSASATVSFVGTNSAAAVQVGVAGALTQFANMPMGAAGAGTPAGSSVQASDYASGLTGSNPQALPFSYINAGQQVVVTLLAATGGVPAGAADVYIEIDWF